MFWKTIFLTKRNDFKKLEIPPLYVDFPKDLITSQNEYWTNEFISINGKNYPLDSCHFLYQLSINENFTFSQTYNGELECFTKKMERDVEIGVEADLDSKYFNLLQGHFINIDEGFWRLKNDSLFLISKNESDFVKFRVRIKSQGELILEPPNSEIFIKLKNK